MIPGLSFLLLLAVVGICLALADDYTATPAPLQRTVRLDCDTEELCARVHARLSARERGSRPVLIGRPPQALPQWRSAQVAA
jgi:hypothetical protein